MINKLRKLKFNRNIIKWMGRESRIYLNLLNHLVHIDKCKKTNKNKWN